MGELRFDGNDRAGLGSIGLGRSKVKFLAAGREAGGDVLTGGGEGGIATAAGDRDVGDGGGMVVVVTAMGDWVVVVAVVEGGGGGGEELLQLRPQVVDEGEGLLLLLRIWVRHHA